MLVGAHCRDVLQAAHGQGVMLRGTDDVDLALAVNDWSVYEHLRRRLAPVGHTDVRFDVGGVPTDLLPFGLVEDPTGVVVPAGRGEPMSVWAFQEVFDHSVALRLPTVGDVRLPTTPGFVALKLAAWLDRSARGQLKDARDIAAAMHWYAADDDVGARLYADEAGIQVLTQYDVDVVRASIHLLGEDVASTIGRDRLGELRDRWPGAHPALAHELTLPPASGWPVDLSRRIERLNALERGLGVNLTTIG